MNLPVRVSALFRLVLSFAALTTLPACAIEPAPASSQQLSAVNSQADFMAMQSSTQELRQRLDALEARIGRQGQGGVSLEDVNARLSRLEAAVARMAATLGVDAGQTTALQNPPAAAQQQPGYQAPPSAAPQQPAYDSGDDSEPQGGYTPQNGSPQGGYIPPGGYVSQSQGGYAPQAQGGYAPQAPSQPPADQAESVYRMAEEAYNQNDMAHAATLLDQLVKGYPNSPRVPDALFWQAQAAARQGDYGKAALLSQDLIQKYPNSPRVPQAMLAQSLAFRKLGKTQAAQAVLQDVVKRFPDTPEARSALAQLRQQQ